jgi:hypothetical protein
MGDSPDGDGGQTAWRASTQNYRRYPPQSPRPSRPKRLRRGHPRSRAKAPSGWGPCPTLDLGARPPHIPNTREGLGKINLQDLPLVNSRKNATSISNPKIRKRSTGTKPPPPLKSSKSEIKNFSNKVRNCSTKITFEETHESSFKTGRRAKIFLRILLRLISGPAYHIA